MGRGGLWPLLCPEGKHTWRCVSGAPGRRQWWSECPPPGPDSPGEGPRWSRIRSPGVTAAFSLLARVPSLADMHCGAAGLSPLPPAPEAFSPADPSLTLPWCPLHAHACGSQPLASGAGGALCKGAPGRAGPGLTRLIPAVLQPLPSRREERAPASLRGTQNTQ